MTTRWETASREFITWALAVLAFAASFEHTRTVVRENGQPGWVGTATAVGIELAALWAVLELRYRRRVGQPSRWPVFALLFGVGASAACNLETRGPGVWGAVVAVMPAALFLLVLGGKATRTVEADEDDHEDGNNVPVSKVNRPEGNTEAKALRRLRKEAESGNENAGEPPAAPNPLPDEPPAPPSRATGSRHRVAELVASIPADDPRSMRQLADDLAPEVGVAPATVRRHLTDLRREVAA